LSRTFTTVPEIETKYDVASAALEPLVEIRLSPVHRRALAIAEGFFSREFFDGSLVARGTGNPSNSARGSSLPPLPLQALSR
jgi:hypothetical protein